MCGILDANEVHNVFKRIQSNPAKAFFDWIDTGKGCLVVGGKLQDELYQGSQGYRVWAQSARRAGRLRIIDTNDVANITNGLINGHACTSDDHHIIALAQVSNTRLLYTNDRDLIQDFTNNNLINRPPGKVFPRGIGRNNDRNRLDLLRNTSCVRA